MTIQREKLLRVQGPRSHTGCRTCRYRHVKCGEELPYCRRCIKAQRPCHYANDEVQSKPIKFILYASQPEPSLPGLTQSERRSLQHFQHRTAEEIPGPFRSSLWTQIIPAAAQKMPAVLHGLLAVSSMHEHYLYAGSDASRALLYDYSIHYYNKAIRQAVRIAEPEDSFDVLLLTSVMLCALEGLKGEFEQSLQHALSGIKIIARGRQGPSTDTAIVPEDMLPKIFLSLQTQAMELEDLSVFRVYPNVVEKFPPLPTHFDDVEDAIRYFQILLNQMVGFSDRFEEACKHLIYIPAIVPEHLLPEFRALHDWYFKWNEAVGCIRTLSSGGDGNQHKAYLILKIYQSVMKIIFESLDKNIPRFDAFESEIMGMLKLAEVFLQTQGGWEASEAMEHPQRTNASPVFSMSIGVVPILFEIAHRSRNRQFREHALRLLRSCNRREGIWDSKLAARLAERHNALQDEIDAMFAGEATPYRVVITDIGLLSEGSIPFKYMVVPSGEHMVESFCLSGFNPPADQQRFECTA